MNFKGKKKGELKGKSERSKEDKNRERRKRKLEKQSSRKEREKCVKEVDRLNPGLGNKYSKRRLLDQLSQHAKGGVEVNQVRVHGIYIIISIVNVYYMLVSHGECFAHSSIQAVLICCILLAVFYMRYLPDIALEFETYLVLDRYMCMTSHPRPVSTLNNYTLELCNEFLYLSVSIKMSTNVVEEKFGQAWSVICNFRPIFKISDANKMSF